MKDTVLFKSKEYGYNGHNYCELRILDDGSIRLWVHDGGTNSLIIMNRADLLALGKQLTKHGSSAPEEVEELDVFMRNKPPVPIRTERKRKPRSDKGKPRVKEESYEEMKARKIQEALE
jgi:hypothetical protein